MPFGVRYCYYCCKKIAWETKGFKEAATVKVIKDDTKETHELPKYYFVCGHCSRQAKKRGFTVITSYG
jgi:hypothetical protein